MKQIMKYLLLPFLLLGLVSCVSGDRYVSFSGYAQGGVYNVTLNMKGVKTRPQDIKKNVDELLLAIDNSLSGYNRNSLLSRFNAGDTIVPDSIFLDIYAHAYDIYEETGGVLDVASAPLFDMWGFGFTSNEFPSAERISEELAVSGMKRLEREMPVPVSGSSLLRAKGGAAPKLNYNAIAQGYSCDVVACYLYSIGASDMMVDIGEIFCDGRNPSGKPWTIGIDRPVDGNNEPGTDLQGIFRMPEGPHGVVTSGNYRKFYVRDGKKYSHTIDPRTGYPVSHNLLSATIVAENGLLADAYATYCMVVGLEEAKAFLTSRPDLEGCLVYDDDGRFATWCSAGFTLE